MCNHAASFIFRASFAQRFAHRVFLFIVAMGTIAANASGLIVNTCGWVDKAGYQLLLHSIQALSIDVLLVMGHDRLFAELKQDMAGNIVVIKLPRSGGVRLSAK